MRFQERDGNILSKIYEYDGVLSFQLLKWMFWPEKTDRAAQIRLAKLVKDDYLCRPTPQQRKTQPIPEPIFWLGWRGIMWVAAQMGVKVDPPANDGENQLRKLDKCLRDQGIRWLREPRFIQLYHDLSVVRFRLAIEQAVVDLPSCRLECWIHESDFRSDGDVIQYQLAGIDGRERQSTKRIYPDSYFVVLNEQRMAKGLPARARFLLELDNASHSNTKFYRDKAVPGLAYLKSPQYKARFGDNSGRWLILTTGRTRMLHLMRQVRQLDGSGSAVFLFSTFDQLESGNPLTKPVWRQVGKSEPLSLLA